MRRSCQFDYWRFARAPLSGNRREETKQTYALRATIDASFDRVRGQADDVLFEFGPSRQHDLDLRDCVRQWQPQLRALSYCAFRHREYDYRCAEVLDVAANRIEGTARGRERTAPDTSELLDRMLLACSADEGQQFPASRIQSFVNLLRTIEDLTRRLPEGSRRRFLLGQGPSPKRSSALLPDRRIQMLRIMLNLLKGALHSQPAH